MLLSINAKQIYLIHRSDSFRYYHSGLEWTWDRWQWKGILHTPNSSITWASPSDCLVSYPSAGIWLVYSTAPVQFEAADDACKTEQFLLLTENVLTLLRLVCIDLKKKIEKYGTFLDIFWMKYFLWNKIYFSRWSALHAEQIIELPTVFLDIFHVFFGYILGSRHH